MHLTKNRFKPSPALAWSQRRQRQKTISLPKMSMKVSEIVERFTKGLDAGVSIRQTSNHPDSKVDLERMSRLDRVEKAYLAHEMKQENDERVAELRAKVKGELEQLDAEAEQQEREREEVASKKATRAKSGVAKKKDDE